MHKGYVSLSGNKDTSPGCMPSLPVYFIIKGKVHTYIVPLEAQFLPVSYQWNASHYLPSRATPLNLGVKDSRKLPTYPCRVGLDMSSLQIHGIISTHLHLSGVKPCQFEARECSTQATSVLTLISHFPVSSSCLPTLNFQQRYLGSVSFWLLCIL